MKEQQVENYRRIAKAISYIRANFKSQPSLEQIADEIGLSPFHFQKLFSEWAGTSPKKFLQYTSLQHAKNLLQKGPSLFDTAYETGLSGTGRLHDLFVRIERMSPAEYRDGGKDLKINYSFAGSLFGPVLVAATAKGICHVSFFDGPALAALAELEKEYPKAELREFRDEHQVRLLQFLNANPLEIKAIPLHLRGTDFQVKVWEALLKIPLGSFTTYGTVAQDIGKASASRAVGTAIGSNPIAYIIPCHRVIRTDGGLGGYKWEESRKRTILAWEECQKINSEEWR